MEEFGSPVQVVKMVEGCNKYELNEELLKSVLMQDNIKDVPVVLVSIAGAYRGGKSFLLNFFLQYIHSKYVDNDDWIQKEITPLEGFKWRGGAERETVGIYIWSRPVYASLPCGTKVAIVLMDTQGIFDNSSTMRDCTTIFALSTLLSSVQIYNLRGNIQEDDLHSLQLFTEYGKMASDNDFKVIQNLKFLVRDWSWDYEYPFGAEGGRQLLDKVLKVEDSQPKELKEIRQQIKSCFHKVDCFLMPHPGFEVLKIDFKGQFADIRSEFQTSLRELVSSIFDPENLTVKMINNQSVTASELFGYFKTYTNIFNSDEILAPITIVKATAIAGLQMTQSKALFEYTQAMDTVCDDRTSRVPSSSLHRLHHDEKAKAIHFFNSRRKMSYPCLEADDHLNALIKDIDVRLPYYELMNNEKFTKILADATKTYEIVIEELLVGDHECVHPQDLITIHQKALETAIKLYDERVIPPEDQDEDEEKNRFIKVLQDRINELMITNDSNNIRAVNESYEKYKLSMNNEFGEQLCVSSRLLQRKHEEEYESARNFFFSKRCISSEEHLEDLYLSDLEQRMNVRFDLLREINERNNSDAVNAAVEDYRSNMDVLKSNLCWHPRNLQDKHETASRNALAVLYLKRTSDTIDADDDQIREVTEITSLQYSEMLQINNSLNECAENKAKGLYFERMMSSCGPNQHRLSDDEFRNVHIQHSAEAVAKFRSFRHSSQQDFVGDDYVLRIIEYADQEMSHFSLLNSQNPYLVEIVVKTLLAVAGFVFGVRRIF